MADDLLEWSLAWARYVREKRTTSELLAPTDLVVAPQETADEAFAREIALAHEVCDDQIKGDEATNFILHAPALPFGGDKQD